jgi:transposase
MDMKREDLEKQSKDELIDMILNMQAQTLALLGKLAEFEARLNMNSTNSSKPPSSDQWKKPQSERKKSGKKPGGQPGQKGYGLKIEREPDETIALKPAVCEKCSADTCDTEGTVVDSRYKVDIEVRTIITRYDQVEVVCPICETANIGQFPESTTSRTQYGEGVRAIGVLFTHYAMVGYDKTQKILNDVFGVPISTGTIVNHVKEFAQKSEPALHEIAQKLKNSALLHCDETSIRVNKKKQWIHTASNGEATYNTVHPKRGQVGTDDNGVLKEFSGTVVHDCLKQYFSYENCVHALCNAHLLRELQGIIDNVGHTWARDMQKLLREMKEIVDRYKGNGKNKLSAYYNKKFAGEYERIVNLGEEENPVEEGQRKRSKARCLLDRFMKYRAEVFRFAEDFRVPFDNNQAERDIRNAKVKQKVSGGLRSDEGAKNFGKISSIIGTAIKQGQSVFGAVSGILSGAVVSLFQKLPVTE